MDARNRWRHAISISMALNIFLLCGIGILSAGIVQTEPMEQLIELDLVSEDGNQQSIETNSAKRENSSAVTQKKSPNIGSATSGIPVVSSPVATQTITSLHVDEVSNNFATDNDRSEIQGASSPVVGGSGNSTVSGGGEQSGKGKGNANGEQGAGKSSGGIIGPKILSQVYPTYPESMRQAGVAGIVILKVQILENGRAANVSVKQSSGHELLDESAVTAVAKWRFAPAEEKNTGRAVVCYTTVPVVFRLE
jgi:protein TonB